MRRGGRIRPVRIESDGSDGEHQQKRDEEREDPQRFGEGDADEQVAV
jgi:hypothetical protein